MSKVSVVILNYNGEKLLKQFLPIVVEHTANATIVVADNGSSDQSIPYVKKNFPTVEVIQLDKNYGFCGGYNLALKKINTPYYVLLNSDIEVTPGWLEPMITLLENEPQVAAVQPKILSYHQKDQFEYAGAGGGFIDTLGYPFCRGRIFNHTEKDEGQYNDTREVFWASGACLVIRSDTYHSLGGLDETFFAHMEEIDLCWKIHRMGKKVSYCGLSTVFHVGAGTLPRNNPRKTYYNFRNGLSLIYKHLPTAQLLYKLPLRLLLDMVAALKFMLEGHVNDGIAVIKAILHFLKSLPGTQRQRTMLREVYPYSLDKVFRGMIIVDYYLLGKKSIPFKNPK
ncbi:MAG: glycosyltransferase family 2 protein [Cyclobacteriaceae bacterium]|nr:glycosyltransferase family 2 protein [Cyclobacteriaceae bacterium]UYN88009.1 MAG: glycosyltransferase family 2 protein [Cyclobacteriaceae bacterium]